MWRQTRHYQRVFGELRSQWSDGKLGAGAARSNFGKGAIAIVVVDSSDVVRKVLVMEGRSVFASFKPRREFDGLSLDELKARASAGSTARGVGSAMSKAIEQIEKIGRDGLSADGAARPPA